MLDVPVRRAERLLGPEMGVLSEAFIPTGSNLDQHSIWIAKNAAVFPTVPIPKKVSRRILEKSTGHSVSATLRDTVLHLMITAS
jgi:hypothetical protein